eukprot:1007837_1
MYHNDGLVCDDDGYVGSGECFIDGQCNNEFKVQLCNGHLVIAHGFIGLEFRLFSPCYVSVCELGLFGFYIRIILLPLDIPHGYAVVSNINQFVCTLCFIG